MHLDVHSIQSIRSDTNRGLEDESIRIGMGTPLETDNTKLVVIGTRCFFKLKREKKKIKQSVHSGNPGSSLSLWNQSKD